MRRILVPEAIQTSAMDCGPASLTALLGGYGIRASYGRLREACQTDVDGTSIDTLEEAAIALGLDAVQTMLPIEHLPLTEAHALPALVVVKTPQGATHFVVVWRRHGPLLQVMDPACGRRWVSWVQFRQDLYLHTQVVPGAAWREWAASDSFLGPLGARLRGLGVPVCGTQSLLHQAQQDPGWRGLATLGAAVRLVQSLVESKGVATGKTASQLIEHLTTTPKIIPQDYWSVRENLESSEEVRLSGAVLIQVRGKSGSTSSTLSPELTAALTEPPPRPTRRLFAIVREGEGAIPALLVTALAAAAAGVLLEALMFRAFFELNRSFVNVGQRVMALSALVSIPAVLALLDVSIFAGLLRAGRRLECRMRVAFLHKAPRLGDRYLQSRPISDMAERSHAAHQLRQAPELAGRFLRFTFELAFTAAAIAWFYPGTATLAILGAAGSIGLPLAALPLLTERDLRLRSHVGALSRFYLDALLGLTAVRAHGAERPLRLEQLGLLREWMKAGLGLQRVVTGVEGLQFLFGVLMAGALVFGRSGATADPAGLLLLVYWSLSMPLLGLEAAALAWQYPAYRNTALRLMEPLGAPQEEIRNEGIGASPGLAGVHIQLENVCVRAAGHSILDEISLGIAPGTHVGIVGTSGAGKSSLVGLLLGWHRPFSGHVLIDGEPLDATALVRLRRQTAWIDPQVRLWNRSLFENLTYGTSPQALGDLERTIEDSGIHTLIEKLPEGMQTRIGEAGGSVSGGEGQRVRFARALLQASPRLVILDEPARGLNRDTRRALIRQARKQWSAATLLSITHDVSETLELPRVIVMERGRIVEDGAPAELAADPDSRYRAMLDAEDRARSTLFSAAFWRRLSLERGTLIERASLADARGSETGAGVCSTLPSRDRQEAVSSADFFTASSANGVAPSAAGRGAHAG